MVQICNSPLAPKSDSLISQSDLYSTLSYFYMRSLLDSASFLTMNILYRTMLVSDTKASICHLQIRGICLLCYFQIHGLYLTPLPSDTEHSFYFNLPPYRCSASTLFDPLPSDKRFPQYFNPGPSRYTVSTLYYYTVLYTMPPPDTLLPPDA